MLALALMHHIVITLNVPIHMFAKLLSNIAKKAVVEFVPQDDPQSRTLLGQRSDPNHGYDELKFESEFGKDFEIVEHVPLKNSRRALYLLKNKRSGSTMSGAIPLS